MVIRALIAGDAPACDAIIAGLPYFFGIDAGVSGARVRCAASAAGSSRRLAGLWDSSPWTGRRAPRRRFTPIRELHPPGWDVPALLLVRPLAGA